MSIFRRAARVDTVQREIVDGLRAAQVHVWIIGRPCDLLVHYVHPVLGWLWMVLEVKTLYGKKAPKARVDPRQTAQNAFLAEHNVPRVGSLSEALIELGLIRST